MSLYQICLLMLCHFSFDWLLQDRETAKKKSSNIKYLSGHLLILYNGLLLFGIIAFDNMVGAFLFALINTVIHGIIVWNIWNLYKYSVAKRFPELVARIDPADFEYYEDSWFYNFIALDQLLHGLTYLGVYYVLKLGGLA